MAVFSEAMAVDLWETGVKVTVVYPGVVDTELFSLPDNDPFTDDVEAITVDEAVGTIMEGIASGALSVYVPSSSPSSRPHKAQDPEAFLAGTAAYVKDRAARAAKSAGT